MTVTRRGVPFGWRSALPECVPSAAQRIRCRDCGGMGGGLTLADGEFVHREGRWCDEYRRARSDARDLIGAGMVALDDPT